MAAGESQPTPSLPPPTFLRPVKCSVRHKQIHRYTSYVTSGERRERDQLYVGAPLDVKGTFEKQIKDQITFQHSGETNISPPASWAGWEVCGVCYSEDHNRGIAHRHRSGTTDGHIQSSLFFLVLDFRIRCLCFSEQSSKLRSKH